MPPLENQVIVTRTYFFFLSNLLSIVTIHQYPVLFNDYALVKHLYLTLGGCDILVLLAFRANGPCQLRWLTRTQGLYLLARPITTNSSNSTFMCLQTAKVFTDWQFLSHEYNKKTLLYIELNLPSSIMCPCCIYLIILSQQYQN